jgi:hypothetical protein
MMNASLLLASLTAVGTFPLGPLYVDVQPPGGGLAPTTMARALTDVGLSAVAAADVPRGCGDRCVKVAVREIDDQSFAIEVLRGGQLARVVGRLPDGASEFDRAHAMAVQIEVLLERISAAPRPRPPACPPSPTDQAPAVALAASPVAVALAMPPVGSDPATPASNPATAAGPPTLAARVAAATAPPAGTERLALEVSGTYFGGLSSDLSTTGIGLGLRLPIGERLDLRTRTALLRPVWGKDQGLRFQRDLLPVDALVTSALPDLPSLRAGLGMAAVHVSDDDPLTRSVWAFGPIARAEYRLPVRHFSFTAAIQGSFLPRAWRLMAARDRSFSLPAWNIGASLGIEFPLF